MLTHGNLINVGVLLKEPFKRASVVTTCVSLWADNFIQLEGFLRITFCLISPVIG